MALRTLEGSNDFQQRVPNPTISGMYETTKAIFDPYNNDLYNEFTHLLNGIMNTYVDGKRFLNPLRELKKPMSMYGNSERHIAVQYMQAHSYKWDDETVWKAEPPEYLEWFYTVNRKDRYEFSFARNEVMRAFSSDGTGFNELLARTLDQQISSDEYDEMNIMLQQFAVANEQWGGLYTHQLSAAPTDEATGKELLTAIRAHAGAMRFPSTRYNNIPVPVFADASQLALFVTPEVRASLDVNTLSSVFNLDRADIQYRVITVPEFPLSNVYAVLCDVDFIHTRDVVYGVYPAPFNAASLSDKYYLHHQSIIAANPAAPVVVFSTNAQTNIPTIRVTPNGLSFTPNAVNVEVGGEVQLNINLTGDVDPATGKIGVEPDAATYTVSAVRSADDGAQAVALNSRTYVDARGILHVQKSGIEVGDVITVTAESVYTNPSGETTTYTATCTATVVPATENGAKECAVEEKPYITYTNDPESTTASE